MCELFADEVEKGNRDTTHLSKTGYLNMITRFKDRTDFCILENSLRINGIS